VGIAIDQAYDLVRELGRTKNYPRNDEAGELALARGLQRASQDFEHARAIVEKCAALSEYCPTDRDMLAVAQEIRPPAPPPSWTPDVRTCPAKLCDGHGWAQTFHLITEERHGEATYKRRERITRDQYAVLARKVDNRTQRVYESAEPCACSPRAPKPEEV
jgi:hypothetical protein